MSCAESRDTAIKVSRTPAPAAATVGTFDGVHLGHRLVISTLLDIAAARGERPVVFTFDRHPLAVIAPDRAPKRLMLPAEEAEAIRALGCDVVMLTFDERLRSMTAREWLTLMRDKYCVRTLLMGYDNNFGSDGRRLTTADYDLICKELGIELIIAGQLPSVSSTAVRGAIAERRVKDAAEMLGRPYSLTGEVIHGDAIGRTIGRPTANLRVDPSLLLPAPGVYAAFARNDRNDSSSPNNPIKALVNIGVRPTVDGHETRVEANLLDFDGDLYGRRMTLEFADRIRDERRFPDLDTLRRQIGDDEERARRILSFASET